MKQLTLYKRKNIDTLIANRFNLDSILLKTESNILQNYNDKHNQSIYEKMKKYSGKITKKALIDFYNKVFDSRTNLMFTSYIYSQKYSNQLYNSTIPFNYTFIQ